MLNKVVDKRITNDLNATRSLLAPYKDELEGVAIESTFKWYWLVDGLVEHDYHSANSNLVLMRTLDCQIQLINQQVLEAVSLKNEYSLLTSMTGTGNPKAGNKYLSWAFSEATNFMV